MSKILSNPKKFSIWVAKVLLCLSFILVLSLFLCYALQPDSFTAVTFYPSWIWTIIGISLSLTGFRENKKVSLVSILFWFIFFLTFAEEPRSLTRGLVSLLKSGKGVKKSENTIRVISLNCAGGKIEAAKEILRYEPDIVLLQETPVKKDLVLFANKLFGENASIVWNSDTAIIVNGKAEGYFISPSKSMFMNQTKVWLKSDTLIEVINVHLFPPVIDLNLLSPDCWRQHKEDRQKRRLHLTKISERIRPIPNNIPIIIGGDFNTKANDGAMRILKERLRDSFLEKGVGWGHTAINNVPFFRIDQIWISNHFSVLAVFSKKTQHSDHRMVICDLRMCK